jgi:hypothetical protein
MSSQDSSTHNRYAHARTHAQTYAHLSAHPLAPCPDVLGRGRDAHLRQRACPRRYAARLKPGYGCSFEELSCTVQAEVGTSAAQAAVLSNGPSHDTRAEPCLRAAACVSVCLCLCAFACVRARMRACFALLPRRLHCVCKLACERSCTCMREHELLGEYGSL